MNFQMFRLVLIKAEEPEIKLPTSAESSKKQEPLQLPLGPQHLLLLLISLMTLKLGRQQDSGELRGSEARWGDLPEVAGLMFSPSWQSRNLIMGHPPCPTGEYVGFAPGVCGPSGRAMRDGLVGGHTLTCTNQ